MNPNKFAAGNNAEQTLRAIKEFERFLEHFEKDLSNMSKKLRNKETAESAGFVATGIHEALHYLTIVKKVVEKTERAVTKKRSSSDSTVLPTGETLV